MIVSCVNDFPDVCDFRKKALTSVSYFCEGTKTWPSYSHIFMAIKFLMVYLLYGISQGVLRDVKPI